MKQHDVSTQELASRMNVTPQYVSEIANGRKNITIASLSKFAKALGVPIAALLEGYQDSGQHNSGQHNSQSLKCPYCGKKMKVIRVDE